MDGLDRKAGRETEWREKRVSDKGRMNEMID